MASHSCQYLVLCFNSLIFLSSESTVQYYLIMVLIYISLSTNDAEHFFICLLAICISRSVKWSFKYFAHLKNWVLSSYYWIGELFITLDISTKHRNVLEVFFPSVWLIYLFFKCFLKRNLFYFDEIYFLTFLYG